MTDKGYIYCIVSSNKNAKKKIYIGSTTRTLKKRLIEHKSKYKAWKKGETCYTTSFELVKFNDCQIKCLEKFDFQHLNELVKKEKEYVQDYLSNNYDVVNKQLSLNIDCSQTTDKKSYNSQYYNLRKDKLSSSCDCECGGKYSKANKSRHFKTKKHLNFEESNKQKEPKINQAIIICEKDTEITIKFNDDKNKIKKKTNWNVINNNFELNETHKYINGLFDIDTKLVVKIKFKKSGKFENVKIDFF
jgi:hypothetical protein